MNLQNDSIKQNKKIQAVLKNWDNKISPHLPENPDAIAKNTGVLQRKQGIRFAKDLMRALFLYASSRFSFRILAVAACALGFSGISDTAWGKRLSKSVPFFL